MGLLRGVSAGGGVVVVQACTEGIHTRLCDSLQTEIRHRWVALVILSGLATFLDVFMQIIYLILFEGESPREPIFHYLISS